VYNDNGENMSEAQRSAKPWDIFNKKIGRVTEIIADQRMLICKDCPFLIKATNQCKKCGCFMNLKTKLPNASCPIGKWQVFNPEIEIRKFDEKELLNE